MVCVVLGFHFVAFTMICFWIWDFIDGWVVDGMVGELLVIVLNYVLIGWVWTVWVFVGFCWLDT